ncbi:LysR family transcriptional regulator [Tropicimonas sp. S265A]|uniref:LysR family transcriptional regulator n=1 Tax=Tropicimonas sp. S265A TaxID=3415134 RepID=UPI003C7DD774
MKKIDVYELSGRHLKLFVEIYDLGSVTEAAKRIGISQSAASHALDRMRVHLGDPLFVRVGRQIVPTDRANGIYATAVGVLADIESMVAEDGLSFQSFGKPITIASNTTEMLSVLSRLKNLIRADAPEVSIRFIDSGNRSNVRTLLENGTADLVLAAAQSSYPLAIKWTHLFSDRIVCFHDADVSAPARTMEAYANATHGTLDFGGDDQSIVSTAVEKYGLHRKIAIAASNSYVLSRLMRGTAHYATLGQGLSEMAFDGFAQFDPPFELPQLNFHAVWHRRSTHLARHRWLLRLVEEAAGTLDRHPQIG